MSTNATKKYIQESHELARKQLIERFVFEMTANIDVFHNINDLTLDDLISESHNVPVFTKEEYLEIYKECKKLLAKRYK